MQKLRGEDNFYVFREKTRVLFQERIASHIVSYAEDVEELYCYNSGEDERFR